jgi:hemerythrin superfamily protein
MSFLDKIMATVMPPESEQDRADARQKAEALATANGWLATALDHHRQIESAFARARTAIDAAERKQAMKELALILTGHAQAEETVLYPALVEHDEKAHASLAYEEQQATKVQMHELEHLEPMSQEWLDKLEHIRGAVLHHMYEEEGTWFIELAEKGAAESAVLTQRFTEEFERYAGRSKIAEPLSEPV